jgi:MFS family permease
VLPVIFAPLVPTTWVSASGFNWGVVVSATLIGIAAAAHQGFSANIFTLTSDMFPKKAVGSVVGLGGFAGAVGGILMATVAGLIKELSGNFVIMFVVASVVYLFAVLVVHLFVPGLKRVSGEELQQTRMPVPVWCVVWAVVGFLAGLPASYGFQDHSMPRARTFPVYVADVISGDIFKIVKPQPATATGAATQTLPETRIATTPATTVKPAEPILSEAEQKANRAKMGWPLLYTPFGLAGIMAVIGALVHGVILRRPAKA